MTAPTPRRRGAIVATALLAAFVLLRPLLAQAVVERGDMLLASGAYADAARLYARALWLDDRSASAADRVLFAALLSHDRAEMLEALALSAPAFAADSASLPLMQDRALLLHRLERYAQASRAFSRAGRRTRDPRLLLLAALDARRSGEYARAQELMRAAVQADPSFAPARRDFRRFIR